MVPSMGFEHYISKYDIPGRLGRSLETRQGVIHRLGCSGGHALDNAELDVETANAAGGEQWIHAIKQLCGLVVGYALVQQHGLDSEWRLQGSSTVRV